jgi:hypothetical protein
MKIAAIAPAALFAALVLSSCNTTDALTPQVDIGDTSTQSTPVTSAEARRIANGPEPTISRGAPEQSFPSVPEQAYQSSSPQSSLEAQAQALQHGQQMYPDTAALMQPDPAPAQLAEQAPQAEEPEPAEQAPKPRRAAPMAASSSPPSSAPAAPQLASLPPAAASAAGTVRFLPIIGAPVQAVTPLSRQLGAEARANGLTIKNSADTSAEHILKGYFSAFSEGDKVTVVYVWDVLDNAGARQHRMQGQESFPSQAQDPWASVPPSLMQQIAQKTIANYLQWRGQQAG